MNDINNLDMEKKRVLIFETIVLFGACFFVFIAPFRFISVTSYTVLMFVAIAFLYLTTGVGIYKNFQIPSENILLYIYVLICFFSLSYSVSKMASIKYCIVLILCLLLQIYFLRTKEWVKRFEHILLIIALVNACITILSYLNFGLFQSIFSRLITNDAMSFAINAKVLFNGYSGIMGQTGNNAFTIVPLVIIAFSRIRNRQKVISAWIYFILSVAALFLTNKRGALLWGLFAIIFIFYLKEKKRNKNIVNHIIKLVFFVIAILLVLYLLYNFVPVVQNVIQRFFGSTDSDLSSGRSVLFKRAIEIIKNHPFGVGIDAYSAAYGENVHNDFLQLTAEVGVAGMLLFFLFYLLVFIKGIKSYIVSDNKYDIQMEEVLGLLIYQFLSCITLFPIHSYGFCIQVFLCITGLQALSRKKRDKI